MTTKQNLKLFLKDEPVQRNPLVPVKGGCLSCPLNGHRIISPIGNPATAKLVIFGQAPGEQENRLGQPFIGPAGQLLWQELRALGIAREDCYVSNIAKCFPGKNPDGGDFPPDPKTRKACRHQWESEWESIRNKVVLVLGRPAVQAILGRAGSSIWGRVVENWNGNRCYPCKHPAAFLHQENEFNRLVWRRQLRLLPALIRAGGAPESVSYSVADNPSAVEEALAYFKSTPVGRFAFDLETTSKLPSAPGARILSVSLSDGLRTTVVECRNAVAGGYTPRLFKALMEDGNVGKIAQNAKFDIVWLWAKWGVVTKGLVFDPSMAQYLLDEGTGTSVSLKQMVWKYMPQFGGYEREIDVANMEQVSPEKLYLYTATDAYVTFKLAETLAPEIERRGFQYVMSEVLLPAVMAVAEMEVHGLKLDLERMAADEENLAKGLTEAQLAIDNLDVVKEIDNFKVTSAHSLRKLFYDKKGFEAKFKTKSGVNKLTKESLADWAEGGSPEAATILKYKKIRKLLKTYYESYKKLVATDGCLHPTYNMIIAKGGRLAAGTPNIQNVPKSVRRLFVSRFHGGKLVQADFKQIEMRIMACESKDPGLVKIFKAGEDPHRSTAAKILNKPPDQVSDEERQWAKSVNFGMLYGMQASTLAEREKMPIARAKQFHDGFFEAFAAVKTWHLQQRAKAESGQKVRSFFGRVRDISAYSGEDRVKRAYNFPIQSAASDVNLFSLGLIWDLFRERNLRALLIATVHDSILVDCPLEEVEVVVKIIQEVVGTLPSMFEWMCVPMDVDHSIGNTWQEVS